MCTAFQRDLEFVLISLNISGINRYEMRDYIKHINNKIMVFVYSDNPNYYLFKKTQRAGFDGFFLEKPLSFKNVQEFIGRLHISKGQQGLDHIHDK